MLTQGQVLQDKLTAWQQKQAKETVDGVKQFHVAGRTARAIHRRQKPLRRRNIFALSAGRWKAKGNRVALRTQLEGEESGMVGIGLAEAVEGITDSRRMLIRCLEVWAQGKDHNLVNAVRERAYSRSVTLGQRARREPATCLDA